MIDKSKTKSIDPFLWLLTVQVSSISIINIINTIIQRDIVYVSKFFWGLDFNDFYLASKQLLYSGNPYIVQRFVTPPLTAIVFLPFTFWDFSVAKWIFSALLLLSVYLSVSLLVRNTKITKYKGLLIILSILLSFPFMFLFDRLNIDAFVMLLLVVILVKKNKDDVLTGLLLFIAVNLKIYPILYLPVFVIYRKWKVLISYIVFQFIFITSTYNVWKYYFLNNLFNRLVQLRLDENGSYFNIIKIFVRLVVSQNYQIIFNVVFAMSYFVILLIFYFYLNKQRADIKKDLCKVIPLMVCFPQIVYLYSFIIVYIFIIAFYVYNKGDKNYSKIIYVVPFCFIHTVAIEKSLINVIGNYIKFIHLIPSFSLLMIILLLIQSQIFNKAKK